jgi:hypothetical protein
MDVPENRETTYPGMTRASTTHYFNHIRVAICAALALFAVGSSVVAGEYDPHPVSRGKFGAKIGIMYAAQFRVDGVSNNAEVGISFGLLLDLPVGRRGVTGLAVDLQDLHIYDKRKKMLDLSLPLKYRIKFEDNRWELRPSAAVGFGYMTVVDDLDRTTYLTLKAGLEAVFHSRSRYSLITDGLVFWAPTGGNADHHVTYGPTLLLRVGFIY